MSRKYNSTYFFQYPLLARILTPHGTPGRIHQKSCVRTNTVLIHCYIQPTLRGRTTHTLYYVVYFDLSLRSILELTAKHT